MAVSEDLLALVDRVRELETQNSAQAARIDELESQLVVPDPGPSPVIHSADIDILTESGASISGATIAPGTRIGSSLSEPTKWVMNGKFLGVFPAGIHTVPLPLGGNKIRIRTLDDSLEETVHFTVSADAPAVVIPEDSPAAPDPAPVPRPAVRYDPPVFVAKRTVNVSNRAELVTALTTQEPGDKIVLASGPYGDSKTLVISTKGPLWICGPNDRSATFDRGSLSSGYNLHLDKANDLRLEGVTLKGGQKGLMADETNRALILNCDIGGVGHEAVHFRNNSTYNTVAWSFIHDTGLTNQGYGEGVYLGQSVNNWDASYSRTNGAEDRSDYNMIIENRIWATTAECIDAKEGTTGGLIRANLLGGEKITGANSADGYIDIKGNSYLIENNTAENPSVYVMHGFETHILHPGWGDMNLFSANSVVAGNKAESLGYYIQVSGSRGKADRNVVRMDNSAVHAPAGLTNIAVSP